MCVQQLLSSTNPRFVHTGIERSISMKPLQGVYLLLVAAVLEAALGQTGINIY